MLDADWEDDRYIFVDGHTKLMFNNALYFVVVTLITVGYGDINPMSTLGKITALMILAQTIIIVP